MRLVPELYEKYNPMTYKEAAKKEMKRSLYASQQVDFPLATMTAYSMLAKIAITQGQLSEALSIASAGIDYYAPKMGQRIPVIGELYLRQAYVYFYQNRLRKMDGLLDEINIFNQYGLIYFRKMERTFADVI